MVDKKPSEKSFTLRVPFTIEPSHKIVGLEELEPAELNGLVVRLTESNGYYVLKVEGFPTEEAARRYLPRIWTGLVWMLLRRGLAYRVEFDLETVSYIDDPEQAAKNLYKNWNLETEGKVDALVNAGSPIVYLSEKNIVTIGDQLEITLQTNASDVYAVLTEGIALSSGTAVIDDQKLRTAIELYNAYDYETSTNARLLTLVMAFETLATSQSELEVVTELVGQWLEEINQKKEEFGPNSEEYQSLNRLRSRLGNLQTSSLRSSIENLVEETLNEVGDPQAADLAKRVGEIYRSRSDLVHGRDLPAEELLAATSDAKEIAKRVLTAKVGGQVA